MESLTAADPRTVGEFQLLTRLGSGGMGTVFLATSPAGRIVAVKIIHPELADDPKFVSRFRGEVSAARKVSGLYTAPLVAAGVEDSPLWLATAFVPGPSLDDIVSRRGPLPVPAVWRLAAGLAEALQAIHAVGLVHRDLKPENVLLAPDGPRVIDFGISRGLTDARLTGAGMLMGTPAYMSPEHVKGEVAGPPGDVFSLGCLLAFAASGTPAFSSPAAATTAVFYRVVHAEPDLGAVPAAVRGLIEACLAKDPARRPDPGQVAELGAAQTKDLGLSAEAYWPPGVARAIQAQQESVTAHVRALQEMPAQRGTFSPDNEADTVSLVASGARHDARAGVATMPPRLAPGLPAPAGPGSISALAHSVDPRSPGDAAEAAAVRNGTSSGNGSAGSGSAGGGSDRNGSAGGGTRTPVIVSPAADSKTDGRHAVAGAASMSRRRLLIGASVAGAAAIGGLAGWAALAPRSSPLAGGTERGSGAGRHPAGGRGAPGHGGKAGQRSPGGPGGPGGANGPDATAAAGEPGQAAAPDIAGLAPGQKVWTFTTGFPVVANPSVAGGIAYVGSRDGHLYAVNVATGQAAWSYHAPGVSAAPTYAAGFVCVAGTSGNFYSINARTGALAWQLTTNSALQFMRSWGNYGTAVVMPDSGGVLRSYNVQTGGMVASFSTPAGFTGTIAGVRSVIYALDAAGIVHAINASSGVTIWRSPVLTAPPAGTGLVADGSIYLGTIGGTLYSLNASTGRVNWQYQAGHEVQSDAVQAYGNVYFRDVSGLIHAVTAATGSTVWTYRTSGSGSAGPAVASNQVYVCTGSGLQVLDALTGSPGWSFTPPGSTSFISTPVVASGVIYVGCVDHNLYAIVA